MSGAGHRPSPVAFSKVSLPATGRALVMQPSVTDIARGSSPSLTEIDPRQVGEGSGLYADLTGVRVLVVDDEVDARELFAMVLESCGAVVTTAGRAAEAYSMIQRDPPQVLVSDIGMPEEDGFSLMRRVRALSPSQGGAIPAVAVTAFTGREHRAQALDAGFNLHVGKPFEPQQLVAIVRRLVS
ncbi:MAG: response regulator [Deltaproteobacteria bacterium]|nr:response regulator [Deltaproteobacteria bacterium]